MYIHTTYVHRIHTYIIHTHTYSVHTYIITYGIYFLVINVNYIHIRSRLGAWKKRLKVKTVDTDKVNLFPKPLPD